MGCGRSEMERSGVWPSGSSVKVSARIMSALAARRRKIQRQPRLETSRLPMVGASSGEVPMMRKSREKTRALSRAWKKSRTMAMAATCAAQPQGLDEAERDEGVDTVRLRQSDGRDNVDDEAEVERALASEAVEERAVEDLSQGEADELGGEREVDGCGGGAEIGGEVGEGREVHVDGEGRNDTEQAQQDDDPGMFVT